MSNHASASRRQNAKVFISYRREDSAGHAGRLFDRISSYFGDRIKVFMDIDSIAPGEDFISVIENAVGACEILVAVIGRNWLTITNEAGKRRLDNPEDSVRVEVATALNRNVRVIPVLVQGVTMPRPEELPEALVKLTRRNAIEISDARWRYDVDRLIKTIEEVSNLQPSGNGKTQVQHHVEGFRMSRLWSWQIIVPVIGIGILLCIGLWLFLGSPPINVNSNNSQEGIQRSNSEPQPVLKTITPSAIATPTLTPKPDKMVSASPSPAQQQPPAVARAPREATFAGKWIEYWPGISQHATYIITKRGDSYEIEGSSPLTQQYLVGNVRVEGDRLKFSETTLSFTVEYELRVKDSEVLSVRAKGMSGWRDDIIWRRTR